MSTVLSFFALEDFGLPSIPSILCSIHAGDFVIREINKDYLSSEINVMKMHGDRIVELHLRQSTNGVWSETFGPGDIDYTKIALGLEKLRLTPHLVIGQCIEDKTVVNINVVEAHKRDLIAVKKAFDRA